VSLTDPHRFGRSLTRPHKVRFKNKATGGTNTYHVRFHFVVGWVDGAWDYSAQDPDYPDFDVALTIGIAGGATREYERNPSGSSVPGEFGTSNAYSYVEATEGNQGFLGIDHLHAVTVE
jgi:hypothetical protein